MALLSSLLILSSLASSILAAEVDNCTELKANIALLPMEGEEYLFAADELTRMPNASITMKYYSKIFSHWTNVKKVFVPMAQRNGSSKLSSSVYNDLHGSDIIIGPYMSSIEEYAKMMNVAYIITKPPTVRLEQRMKEETYDKRVLFSIWPSWETFYKDSIQAMLDSRMARSEWGIRSLGRVLIIREGLSEAALEQADLLQKILIDSGMTTRLQLTTLTRHQEDDAYSILYDVISPVRPHIIVYLYDKKEGLNLLFQLYRTLIVQHRAGQALLLSEWYFWDMTSPYAGLMHKLLTGDGYQMARKLKLRSINIEPCIPLDGFKCDHNKKDSTELIGFAEAIEFTMLMVCKNDLTFSIKDVFLSLLRITDYQDATIYDYCYTHLTAGMSFENGFRIFPGIHVGILRPKKVVTQKEKKDKKGHVEKKAKSHTYLNCASKRELHWTRYYDKTKKEITTNISRALTRPKHSSHRDPDAPVQVVVVAEEPFAFQEKFSKDWQGITVEIVDQAFEILSQRMGTLVKYKLYKTAKNEYGAYLNKTWSGAMGELKSGNADVAIGMISKTKQRQHHFDYSPAFEFVGLTYMGKTEEHEGTMFGFMSPFDPKLWWGIMATFILAAIFIRILDYWNPFIDDVEDSNRFNFHESVWYSFGAVSGYGGGDFAPYMHPTRVFTVFYWFFALVITASYTGNLASFLTEKYEIYPSLKVSELYKKKGQEWGTLKGSFMESYLASMSDDLNYKATLAGLKYVDSYEAGAERVREGDFAFIGNNLLLKFHVARDPSCSLALSPHTEAFTELAFPINKKWKLKRDFINAMVQMRADGSIANILKRWLHYDVQCENPEAEEEEEHTSLGFNNFYGLYIVLVLSICISFLVLFLKLAYLKCKGANKKRRNPQKDPEENGESAQLQDKDKGEAISIEDDKETDV